MPFVQMVPAMHALPHEPQLAFEVWRSAHVPLQSMVPDAQVQVLLLQTWLFAQLTPHRPQLLLSVLRLTHEVPHLARPLAQAAEHAPLLHTCPPMQRLPHAPQFVPSDERSAHTRMQSVSPEGHMHTPAVHTAPMSHRLPQLPQSVVEVCVSTHRPAPPHAVSPVGQPIWQVPAVQLASGPQRLPQPPQSFGSVLVSTHCPLQLVVPAPQLHMPPEHEAPVAQTSPQPPQSFGSVDVSTQALLQSVKPVPHVVVQTPAEQTCEAPQTLPHVPQLLGSLCVSVQTPLQRRPLL